MYFTVWAVLLRFWDVVGVLDIEVGWVVLPRPKVIITLNTVARDAWGAPRGLARRDHARNLLAWEEVAKAADNSSRADWGVVAWDAVEAAATWCHARSEERRGTM